MLVETNLIDISQITLENYSTYNERIKYEMPKQRLLRDIATNKRTKLNEEEKKQHLREYQHKYYMEITKKKRQEIKELLGGSNE